MHTEEFVGLTNDLCFKKVFSKKEILEDFINSFFKFLKRDVTYEYSDITFQSAIMPNNKNIKMYYGDIIVTLNNGDIISLEMYKNSFTKRDFNKSFSYICRLYANQKLTKENNYEDNKKVISINLIKGNFKKINESIVNEYDFRKKMNNKQVDEGNLEMHLVRFDLSKKVGYNLFNERFVKWLKLINCQSLEEMKEIGKGDEIMENSIRVVDEWNKTHIYTWDDYISEQKDRARYIGREEGREEGREKGFEEGILKAAKNLIKMGMSITDIKTATGLSEDAIQKLI